MRVEGRRDTKALLAIVTLCLDAHVWLLLIIQKATLYIREILEQNHLSED